MSENTNLPGLEEIAGRIAAGNASDEEMQRYLGWLDILEAGASQTTIPNQQEIELLLQQRIWRDAGITPVRKLKNRSIRWMAAASIILVILTGGWWWLQTEPQQQAIAVGKTVSDDKQPGGNRAMLRLPGGRLVSLDSSTDKYLLKQSAANLDAVRGQLAYRGQATTMETHELITPAGGQFQLVLPDGTRVWLNAASSILYPTAFATDERVVTIRGEAYFEVAKDAKKPFRVEVGNETEIRVMGTHFNINAYGDDNTIRTTLLEGKVQVQAGSDRRMLAPGEQGVVRAGRVAEVTSVNTEGVMAWMSQQFYFDNADVGLLMKQLARWYDVKLEFRNTRTPNRFSGYLPRQAKLSEIIRILQLSGIHLRLDGNLLIVND